MNKFTEFYKSLSLKAKVGVWVAGVVIVSLIAAPFTGDNEAPAPAPDLPTVEEVDIPESTAPPTTEAPTTTAPPTTVAPPTTEAPVDWAAYFVLTAALNEDGYLSQTYVFNINDVHVVAEGLCLDILDGFSVMEVFDFYYFEHPFFADVIDVDDYGFLLSALTWVGGCEIEWEQTVNRTSA